jgi:hypothetical protein
MQRTNSRWAAADSSSRPHRHCLSGASIQRRRDAFNDRKELIHIGSGKSAYRQLTSGLPIIQDLQRQLFLLHV